MAMDRFDFDREHTVYPGSKDDGNGVAAVAFVLICYAATALVLVVAFCILRHFGIL